MLFFNFSGHDFADGNEIFQGFLKNFQQEFQLVKQMVSVFVLYMKPLFVLINNCTAFLCKSNQLSLMALDVHM